MERADTHLNAVLAARTAGLDDASSLGPPDLCYLHKHFEPRRSAIVGGLLGAATDVSSTQPSEATPCGFFHHVLGLDVSSPAPVATYVAELAAAEQAAAQGSWLATGTWRVSGAIYACWDVFRRVDLRVRVSIPGGVHVTIVQPDGRGGATEMPAVDDEAWRRFAMSALLRALCPAPTIRPLRQLPPPLAPEQEASFLDSSRALLVDELDADGAASGGYGGSAPRSRSMTSAASSTSVNGLLCAQLYTYFAQSKRYEQALAFFAPLAVGGVRACGEMAAAAQRELGLLPEAILAVGAMITSTPSDGALLLRQAQLLLQCHMLLPAMAVAAHATRLAPTRREGWLSLARAQLAARQHFEALQTLNGMPIHMLRPPPGPAVVQLPTMVAYDDHDATSATRGAAVGDGGAERVDRALAAVGDGTRPPSSLGPLGRSASADEAERALADVYAFLAEVARDIGWEELLDFREHAFVMAGGDDDERDPETNSTSMDASLDVSDATEGIAQMQRPTDAEAVAAEEMETLSSTESSALAAAHHPPNENHYASNGGMLPASMPASGRKRRMRPVCHMWLDDVFTRLHADLCAYDAWLEDEASMQAAAAHGSAAGGVTPTPAVDAPSRACGAGGGMGVSLASNGAGATSAKPTKTLQHAAGSLMASVAAAAGFVAPDGAAASGGRLGGTSPAPGESIRPDGATVDDAHWKWLARARLAERLLRPASARVAYTRAVQALEECIDGGPDCPPVEGAVRDEAEMLWTEACTTLMRLHAEGGEGATVTEALAAAHRLLDECGPLLAAGSGAGAAADVSVAPREITACVYQLVAEYGLQHVRAAQRSIGEPHAALNHIFHEVVQWKVRGFDR